MKNDLTIIFLTVNRVPHGWAAFHKEKLLEAIKGFDLITVSAVPMDMPGINIIQDEEVCASNIYKQMLRAAKIAKTKYVAIVEDDSLYPREHFIKERPADDEFLYNFCRWSLFTWGEPTYYTAEKISNLTLIAPRKLLIEALQERFDKYPLGIPDDKCGELGRERVEKLLRVTHRKSRSFYTTIGIVNLNHTKSIDPYEQTMRKRRGFMRAYDIPHWGHAKEIQNKFV